MSDAPRDQNRIPALLGELDDGSGSVAPLKVDAATGRLKVTATGSGLGSVTSVAMTVPTGLTVTGSPVTTSGTLAVALDTGYVIPLQSTLDAKMTNPMTTGGDLIYGGASGTPTRLANGLNGQVLTSSGGTSAPTWATPATGSVTTVSVVTANGVSGSVANATTTPAITLTLGAITPTSVNSVVISGSSTPTLAVTGTTAVSGTNTGDQLTFYAFAVSGQDTVTSAGDSVLTLVAGSNVTLTTDDTSKSVTISAAGGVSFGTEGQVPFVNAGGDDFQYSAGFAIDTGEAQTTLVLGTGGSDSATYGGRIYVQDAYASNALGGELRLRAGAGDGTGGGGILTIAAGRGGATNGTGGDVIVSAGAGGGGNADGGYLYLLGGLKSGSGSNGLVAFQDASTEWAAYIDTSALSGSRTLTLPNASGTLALQTAASGSFTTADAKTVTVVNGIITSIV